jgi:predicted 2-oxoglutarate/Fe(II)-dependent dioxygenase YbiX
MPSFILPAAHHRVKKVLSGERWAAITWIQSMIPDASLRRILYDLELVATMVNHKSQALLKLWPSQRFSIACFDCGLRFDPR